MGKETKWQKFIKSELFYSMVCILIVSAFLLFGILYFIPTFQIFGYFFLLLFVTLALIFYYQIRYGSSKSRVRIDEKYYTMQIRRLKEQHNIGYIDDEQYQERVKEFEKKLKKE